MSGNTLSPSAKIVSFSPFHTATEIPIEISPDVEDRDVYTTGNDQILPRDWATRANLDEEQTKKWKKRYGTKKWVKTVALTNQGLIRILTAIDSKILKNGLGDSAPEPFTCHWAFESSYTQSDGSQGVLSGDYMLDLRLPEDVPGGGARYQDIYQNQKDKLILAAAKTRGLSRKERQPFDEYKEEIWFSLIEDEQADIEKVAAYRARTAVIKRRPFLVQLAQTGARNRAIRAMGVKSWYFQHELEHPLLIQRLVFDWDKAGEELGSETKTALLLALVEKEYGVQPDVKALTATVLEPEETVVEGEFTESEEMIDREEDIEFDKLGFNAPYDGLKSEQGVKDRLVSMIERLKELGYETQEARHELLSDLFPGMEIMSGFLVGHIKLLDSWISFLATGGEIEEANEILEYGFEHSANWEKSAAFLQVDKDPEIAEEVDF